MQELLLAPLSYDPEVPAGFGYGWELLLTAMTDPDPGKRPTAAEVAELASELQDGANLSAATSHAESEPTAAEPVAAIRAVDQSRETASAYRRRRAVWAWVTHYR